MQNTSNNLSDNTSRTKIHRRRSWKSFLESLSNSYCKIFKTVKQVENKQVTFNHNKICKRPFPNLELQDSLNKAHSTTASHEENDYQFLKHLRDVSLHYPHLTQPYMDQQQHSLILEISHNSTKPKPGRDNIDSRNYQTITLTICLWRTIEKDD